MQHTLYRINKHPWVTYSLLFINVVVFISIEFSEYSTQNVLDLLDWGANFNPYTFDTEWWRLISSMFLHGGIIHLVVNMYSLHSLGTYLEETFGHRMLMVTYFMSGIIGSLASGYFSLFVVSVGASGAIFGIYGFHMFQVITNEWNNKSKLLRSIAGFVIYVAVITWIGTKANFDNAAHLGGLTAGIIISSLDFFFNKNKTYAIYPKIFFGASLLIIIGYFQMPRYQVNYFKMFQKLIETDKNTTTNMNGRHESDSVMAQQLDKVIVRWDTLQQEIDSLSELPQILQRDRDLIKKYAQLKIEEIGYILKSIRQESYVYMDSLDLVRSETRANPPLSYYLNYNRSEIDTTNQNSSTEPQGTYVQMFYDSLWKECEQPNAHYYRVGTKDTLNRWNGFVQDYYKNGAIQMKGKYQANLRDGIFLYYNEDSTYSSAGRYDKDYPIGKWEQFYGNGIKQADIRYLEGWVYTINTWDSLGRPMIVQGNGEEIYKYDNGVISSYTNFIEGRIEGESYGFHENGERFYKEYYIEGRLSHGISYGLSGDKYEYDIGTFIPHPNGGAAAFQKYIEDNKVYPIKAKTNNITGELEVVFTVFSDGTIGDVKSLNYLGYGCEEEAERLLLEGRKWVPAHLHGITPIRSESRIRISFP